MNESVATEEMVPATEAPTQRLAFDTVGEGDIPQLKKTPKLKVEESEMEEAVPVENPVTNGEDLQSLAELSIEQLKAQQAELERRILEKQTAERTTVIAQISQVMRDYDITLQALVEALGGMKFKRQGAKAKPKYKDPATGTTWSGRGKEPHWIKGVADRTPFEI